MSSVNFMEKLLDGIGVEWKALGEVGVFIRGKRFVKTDIGRAGRRFAAEPHKYTIPSAPHTHYGKLLNDCSSSSNPRSRWWCVTAFCNLATRVS